MDAHPLDVRRDRAVDEREAWFAGVLLAERVEAALPLPHIEHTVVDLGQVELRGRGPESRLLDLWLSARRHAHGWRFRSSRTGAGAPGRGATRSSLIPFFARLRHGTSFAARFHFASGRPPLGPTTRNAAPKLGTA